VERCANDLQSFGLLTCSHLDHNENPPTMSDDEKDGDLMSVEQNWERLVRRTGLRDNEIAHLQRLPLFEGLEPTALCDLIADATVRQFRRGGMLFVQEEPADRFFIVLEGFVKLSRETPDGNESVIGLFGAGESFAEAAMFERATFPVDGTAIENTRVLVIPAGSFRRRLVERPELMFKLLGSMSKHMRRLVQQIEQLTTRTSAERVAGFFASLSRDQSGETRVRLPVEKTLIAGRLGMQPETFSRALARLRDHGLAVDGSEVLIQDAKRLQRFARSGHG
jgi:CRP-like cAMP-binding protein